MPRCLAFVLPVAAVSLGAAAWSGCSPTEWQMRNAIAKDPQIRQLQETRSELSAERPALVDAFGPDHASVRTLDYQLGQVDQMIELRQELVRREWLARQRAARGLRG
jgi:uncharacterized protein involved in exopolysaccharide biosynthesis